MEENQSIQSTFSDSDPSSFKNLAEDEVPQKGETSSMPLMPSILSNLEIISNQGSNKLEPKQIASFLSCLVINGNCLQNLEDLLKDVYALITHSLSSPDYLRHILTKFKEIQIQSRKEKNIILLISTKKKVGSCKKAQIVSLNNLSDAKINQIKKQTKDIKYVKFLDDVDDCISIKLINNTEKSWKDKQNRPLNAAISFQGILQYKNTTTIVQNPNSDEDSSQNTGSIKDDISSQPQIASTSSKKQYPQVSIVFFEERQRETSYSQSEESQQFSFLSALETKKILSLQLIQDIFDESSPFLVNMTLCLLFKFFVKSKFQPKLSHLPSLLSISAMIAHKLFFDETIEGLIAYYSKILQLSYETIVRLERQFLAYLDYEVIITNKHFTQMMTTIVSHHPKND